MVNKNQIVTDYAIVPGETIKDTLDYMNMTQENLAERLGLTPKTVSKLINGESKITPELALKLELVFDVPAHFWNNLQQQYDEDLARLKQQEIEQEFLERVKEFNYTDMANNNFVPKTKDKIRQGNNILKFFGYSSFDTLMPNLRLNPLAEGAFRVHISENTNVNPIALHAWIQEGEIQARRIDTEEFNKQQLIESIPDLRRLTLDANPEKFVQQLQEIAASFGVAVVFVPALKGSRVSGVTRWQSPFPRAIVELSLRYKTNDSLWFTFFHELAHLVLHRKQTFYTVDNATYANSEAEEQANVWAADKLIPRKKWADFIDAGNFTREAILTFAEQVQIHAGIVLGRLQKEERLPYSAYSDLKVRFTWNN